MDVAELLKEKIDCNNISLEIVSEATGIPVKRVERTPLKNYGRAQKGNVITSEDFFVKETENDIEV